MNIKLVSTILIFIFLLSSIPVAFASNDDDKYYVIDLADIFLDIQENGLLKVNESYTYTFHGQYNGVYRDIPIKDGQSIENLQVSADGAYTKVETNYEDGYYKIKVYLYSDSELTKPIKDSSVKIHYSYDFKDVIKVYNDVGEIQYKLWGDEWDQDVMGITAHIRFPDNQKIQYWINPVDAKTNQSWEDNVLTIKSDSVSSDSYLEFRGIIPLSEFNNPIYAHKIDKEGYEEIVNIQEDYAKNAEFQNSLNNIIPIILLISLLIPVAIYFKYGREPKIEYDAPYERELPTDDDPIFVDAMFGTKSDAGKVTDNGIQATIMELISNNIIKIDSDHESKNLKLILPDEYDELPQYMQNIITLLLKPYSKDNVLDFKDMKNQLTHEAMASAFNKNLNNIKKDYEDMEISPVLRQYFNNKGSNLFKFYSIGLIIVSVIVLIYSFFTLSFSFMLLISSILFIFIGFIIFVIPNRVGGRWTVGGYTKYKKWNAFKKFIKDFSLIKQYPPESIAVWDKYLIYATALGNAKAVNKAMETIGQASEFDYYSDVYYYNMFGGPILFASVINQSNITVNSNSGINGPGGGSGGGGGGAF